MTHHQKATVVAVPRRAVTVAAVCSGKTDGAISRSTHIKPVNLINVHNEIQTFDMPPKLTLTEVDDIVFI